MRNAENDGSGMIPEGLAESINAVTPPGITHIGLVGFNSAGELLVTEPEGHPYGVSATFSKVKIAPGETPAQTLGRCLKEQVGQAASSAYPLAGVWVTANSAGFYFAGLLPEETRPLASGATLHWCTQQDAHSRIASSKNAASVKRDLGILAAATAICVSPERRLLLMVQELHRQGFERLRVTPRLAASGCHWRCSVLPVTCVHWQHGAVEDDGAIRRLEACIGSGGAAYRYPTAAHQQPFGWMDAAFDSPVQLAEKYLDRNREIAFAGYGPDPEYVRWYNQMLESTGPNGLIYAMADYPLPKDHLPVGMMRESIQVPLPPPGQSGAGRS